jgi:hypothetical protein
LASRRAPESRCTEAGCRMWSGTSAAATRPTSCPPTRPDPSPPCDRRAPGRATGSSSSSPGSLCHARTKWARPGARLAAFCCDLQSHAP